MAEIVNQRIVESSILEDSIAGLKTILGKIAADYGKPALPVAMVPSSFFQRDLAQQFGGNTKYPCVAVTLLRMTENMTGYNNNLRRIGKSVVSGDKVLTYKLMPTTIAFRVRFFSQDYNEMIKFSKRWMQRQKDGQFKLQNDKIEFNIKVRLNNDLTIPEQEMSDFGNFFILETDCELSSYTGEIETTNRIKELNVSSNLWDRTQQIPVAGSERVIQLKSK